MRNTCQTVIASDYGIDETVNDFWVHSRKKIFLVGETRMSGSRVRLSTFWNKSFQYDVFSEEKWKSIE